ncbi:FHA domain-containing protein [Pauljensenia sp. 20925_1_34]|uniref:FHA domain-containing protein n=1 Tax=Pauljensenia sp. 20925_1_34 TaxID=3003674 RepID=UPI00352C9F03
MTATSPDLVAVPASPGKRVAALLIDIVGAALFGAVASALSHGNVAVIVTTIVEYVALQAILIALHGRSVGAFLARCALVRAGSSQLSPSLMVSAGYVLLTALSSLIPPLPVIFVLLGGQRGSWMAKLFSLQCVTFVPEDTIDEAVASSSPYGKAGAGIAEGHTSFSSVTDIPSAPISHSSESPASAQPSVKLPKPSAELPKPSVELPKPSAPASSRAWPAPAPASSVPYVPGPQIPAPVQEVPAAAPVQEEAMPEAPATAPAPTPAWARETHTPKAPIGAPIPTPTPVQEMQAPKAPVAPPAPTARFSAPMPQPLAREASAGAPPAEVEAPRPPEPAVPAPALPTTAPKPAATATNSTTASAPASASYAALLLDTGQSIPVNRTIVLGRAPSPQRATDSPIPVEDQTRSLSRTHVRIAPSEGGITIEDLNSANGTRARSPNGQTHTLVPGQPIELPMNSQLLLGERLISVVDLRQRR